MRTRAPRHFAAKVLLVGIGCVGLLFKEAPGLAFVLAGIVLVLVVVAAMRSSREKQRTSACGVCGQQIARTYYTGTLDGVETVFCPNCRRRIVAKASREAVERMAPPPRKKPSARRTILRPGETSLPR